MNQLKQAYTSTTAPPRLTHLAMRIAEKTQDRAAAPVTVIAFGDSVTQGIGPPDVLYHDAAYHARVKSGLEERFPLCTFNVLNAGVDGNTAADGERRMERDVIRYEPDLTLVAFCLNDASLGTVNLAPFRMTLRTMIDRVRSCTAGELMLVTPNMMLTRENDAIPDRWRNATERLLRTQRSGTLTAFVEAMREVASDRGVPVADVYAAWQAMAAQGTDTTALLSNGLNHPNKRGHLLASRIILAAIDHALADPTSD